MCHRLAIMKRLTEDHFSFKCPMRWEDMAVSANGRFCERCRKEVFDLTNCSLDEVIALQRKHGSLCGSVRVARAAVVAASLSAAACQTVEPTRATGVPCSSGETAEDRSTDMLMGEIQMPKEDSIVVPGMIAPLDEGSEAREKGR